MSLLRFFRRRQDTWHALALLGLLLCAAVGALADVPIPAFNSPVTDLTNTLSPAQHDALVNELLAFERRKGAQIAVLIVPTTEPETIDQYAVRAFEAGKFGRKNVDDGVLLVVAKDDRALKLEIGYGLEGAIPDAVAKRVIEEIIIPFFKQGDFYAGIEAGVNRLMRLVDGEPLPSRKARDHSWNRIGDLLPLLFIAVFVVGGILRAMFGQLIGASIAGGIVGVLAWFMVGLLIAVPAAVIVFLLSLTAGSSVGRGGGGFGGWGGGGGFGGGSWSGGGGSSGGGGASGRW